MAAVGCRFQDFRNFTTWVWLKEFLVIWDQECCSLIVHVLKQHILGPQSTPYISTLGPKYIP